MPRHDALVLDLDTRAGLATARALGRAGLRVGVASRDGGASGMRTRFAARRLTLPDPESDLTASGDALLAYLREQPTDAVLCSIDSSLETLHRRRDEFGAVTSPAIASYEAVEIATSKSATLDLAAELGIAAPRSLRVTSAAEVADAVAELGLPAVLKPDGSWLEHGAGGERVAPEWLADEVDVQTSSAHLVRDGAVALVQEVAPGARETVKLFRAGGRWLARLAMTTSRTWPPLGGSSVMRWSAAPDEDVVAPAERLVEAMGIEGYAEVEFRRSATGEPLLMEVNPRLSQSVEVAVRAGVDFPRMQLEWARGGKVEQVSRYATGVRVGWLAGDVRLLAAAALQRGPAPRPQLAPTAKAFVRDYLTGARLEGLDLRDPRPVLAALAFTARSAASGSGPRRSAAPRA